MARRDKSPRKTRLVELLSFAAEMADMPIPENFKPSKALYRFVRNYPLDLTQVPPGLILRCSCGSPQYTMEEAVEYLRYFGYQDNTFALCTVTLQVRRCKCRNCSKEVLRARVL